jgi:hypothetical protein
VKAAIGLPHQMLVLFFVRNSHKLQNLRLRFNMKSLHRGRTTSACSFFEPSVMRITIRKEEILVDFQFKLDRHTWLLVRN